MQSSDQDPHLLSAVYVLSKLAKALRGEVGVKIIETMATKGEVTDKEIADSLGMSEAEVRKILWHLHDEGIVVFKKVTGQTGWISFYWTLPTDQVDGILLLLYRRVIDRIEKRLEYERQNIFYWCGAEEHPKYTFSEASDQMFKCEKCGKMLIPIDNTKLITALSWALSELKKIYKMYFSDK